MARYYRAFPPWAPVAVLLPALLCLALASCQARPRDTRHLALFYAPVVENPPRYLVTYSKTIGDRTENSNYDLEISIRRGTGEENTWQAKFKETARAGEKSTKEELSYLLDEFGYPATLGRQEESVLSANRFFGYLLPRLPRGLARPGETWESVIFVRPFVVEIGPPLLLTVRYTLLPDPGQPEQLNPFALRISAEFSAEQSIPRDVAPAAATFYCRVNGRAEYFFSASSGSLTSSETSWEYQVEHRQHSPEPISEKGRISVVLSPR